MTLCLKDTFFQAHNGMDILHATIPKIAWEKAGPKIHIAKGETSV